MATICYCLLGRKVKGTAERPLEAGIPSCPSYRQTAAQTYNSLVISLAVMFPLPMIFKSLLFQLYHRVSLSVYTCLYITLSGSLINTVYSHNFQKFWSIKSLQYWISDPMKYFYWGKMVLGSHEPLIMTS